VIVGQGYVTGLAAIGTVIQPIGAQAHVVLAFADGAVLFAIAVLFRLLALRAYNLRVTSWHARLRKALYLSGQEPASEPCRSIYRAARAAGELKPESELSARS